MELNEKHIEQIGLYLQGRLKGDQLSSFLEEVKQNAALKEELDLQQTILNGIEHKQNQELRARFKKISEEVKYKEKEAKVVPMPLIKIIASIAAVCLICFAAYFVLDNSSDSETLFAKYYEPSEVTITRSTDMEADLVKAKELYHTKQYDKALPLFKNIIASNPSSADLRLAYGNTLLNCNKLNLAREQFNYIIDSDDPLYSDQSRWYLGLLELRAGNNIKAVEVLSPLVRNADSDFHLEAKALLAEIQE